MQYSFLLPYQLIISDIPKNEYCVCHQKLRHSEMSEFLLCFPYKTVSYFVFSILIRGLVGICGPEAAQISTFHKLQPHKSLLVYCSRAQTKNTFIAPEKGW